MAQEALITVPVQHARWITEALNRAGVTVLDTGDRVTTEDQVAGEAVLCVAAIGWPDREQEVSTSSASIPE